MKTKLEEEIDKLIYANTLTTFINEGCAKEIIEKVKQNEKMSSM